MTLRRCARWLALAVALGAVPTGAWPILDEKTEAGGLALFPDHEVPDLYWAVARRVEVPAVGEANAFHAERYRYEGREATGDAGARWTRGTISFAMHLRALPEQIDAASAQLRARRGRAVEVRPIRIDSMETRVLLPTPSGEAKEIAGRFAAPRSGVWTEERVVIGLDETATEALWESFDRTEGGLRIACSLYAQALATRPLAAVQVGDEELALEDDAKPARSLVAHEVLSVEASPTRCPSCFETTLLADVDDRGFPVLHLYADELVEGGAGLVRLVVQVEATASDGSVARLDTAFRPEDEPLATLRFRHPVQVDAGYRVRVVRIHDDGRSEEGPWATRRFGPLFVAPSAAEATSHDATSAAARDELAP